MIKNIFFSVLLLGSLIAAHAQSAPEGLFIESKENIAKTIAETHATFPVFSDEDLKIMKAYDVAFEIPENTVTRYRNSNIHIEKINGSNGKWLPVPAVYIIDK